MLRHEAADVLQVPAQATQEEIRRAYLAAARRAHPDLGGSASEFKRVAEAYAALTRRSGQITFPPPYSSSSSAYYHYNNAASAASSAAFRPARPSFSNVTIALVLSVPLALAGVAAAHASGGGAQVGGAGGGIAREARPHGLLSPPVNEFLKEERRARVAPSRLVPAFREWGRGWVGR